MIKEQNKQYDNEDKDGRGKNAEILKIYELFRSSPIRFHSFIVFSVRWTFNLLVQWPAGHQLIYCLGKQLNLCSEFSINHQQQQWSHWPVGRRHVVNTPPSMRHLKSNDNFASCIECASARSTFFCILWRWETSLWSLKTYPSLFKSNRLWCVCVMFCFAPFVYSFALCHRFFGQYLQNTSKQRGKNLPYLFNLYSTTYPHSQNWLMKFLYVLIEYFAYLNFAQLNYLHIKLVPVSHFSVWS